jgi:hypothetical protein
LIALSFFKFLSENWMAKFIQDCEQNNNWDIRREIERKSADNRILNILRNFIFLEINKRPMQNMDLKKCYLDQFLIYFLKIINFKSHSQLQNIL